MVIAVAGDQSYTIVGPKDTAGLLANPVPGCTQNKQKEVTNNGGFEREQSSTHIRFAIPSSL